jgi:hypothetical protein
MRRSKNHNRNDKKDDEVNMGTDAVVATTQQVPFTPVKPIQIAPALAALQKKISAAFDQDGWAGKVSANVLWGEGGRQVIGLRGSMSVDEYDSFSELGKRLLTDKERGLIAMIKVTEDDRVEIYPSEY